MIGQAYLTYALNQEGDLVHVDSVPNGNDCGCFCPHCNSPLCAKNGGDGIKMIHHFAHLSGADCVGAVESALHKMAKDILLESKCVFLPKWPDGRREGLIHFDRVEIEYNDKDTGLRPDSVGYYGDKVLWVEFKRTHAVDTDKKAKIISAHIDCIEIDLNCCQLDPDALKDFIINSSQNRSWIIDNQTVERRASHPRWSLGSHVFGNDFFPGYKRLVANSPSFAKDETGQFIDLTDNSFNLKRHAIYCLVCERKLSYNVDETGLYRFFHSDGDNIFEDFDYLREAAKEIIIDRFNRNDLTLLIPQYQTCVERDTCHFFDEDVCCKLSEFPYNLKEWGYTMCLKDYVIKFNDFKSDLVIKHKKYAEHDIIIAFNIKGGSKVPKEALENKCIEIKVDDEEALRTLQYASIDRELATYINFRKRTTGFVSRGEASHRLLKFELFTTGKYFLTSDYCYQTNFNHKRGSTIYELMFLKGMYNPKDAKAYALYRCFISKRHACYCEICSSIDRKNSTVVCNCHKDKGTPQHPLKVMPTSCPHFNLDLTLVTHLEVEYSSVKYLERL